MAKKIDLEALHQQINELQIDKDLNRGKLHPLSGEIHYICNMKEI